MGFAASSVNMFCLTGTGEVVQMSFYTGQSFIEVV
jgi:hypothetical protein